MTDESKTVKLETVAWRWRQKSDDGWTGDWTLRTEEIHLIPPNGPYLGIEVEPLYGPEAAARIEELEADNVRLIGLASQAQHNKNATERLLIDARARLETAVKALEPFAVLADYREAVALKALPDTYEVRVKLGDLRRARQALAQPKDIS